MSRDWNIDEKIRYAAKAALDMKCSWADSWDDTDSNYEFSNDFVDNMGRICGMAEHNYVSLGRFRIRCAAAAALIAAVLMLLAGCTYAVTQVVIHWNETQNNANGTLDVYFDVDDPDGTLENGGLRKPETPEGYEVVSEDKEEGSHYMIEYLKGKEEITYSQMADVESMGLSIDSDDPGFKEITINGYKGYSSHDEYGCFMIWSDGVYLYNIGGSCSMNIIKRMAESIE